MNTKTRDYRTFLSDENSLRVPWQAKVDSSDLYILSREAFREETEDLIRRLRADIMRQEDLQPGFMAALNPLPELSPVPDIIRAMYSGSAAAGTGPMAAVAGAIAEAAGRFILTRCPEVIVENGGDLWLKLNEPAAVQVVTSSLSFRGLGIKIRPEQTPCGLCTSTGRFGHSLSFGRADTATVYADSGAAADASATAVCNMVQGEEDLIPACDFAMNIPGVRGVLITFRDRLAARGDIELTDIKEPK